jgi:PilZ domain
MDQRTPAPRIEVNCPVWIDLADGSPLRRCTAVNLSRTGAKLSVGPAPLPERFIVRFSPSSGIAVLCKRIWSREGAVGVSFVSRVDDAATPK